jgi:GT2 family glycosyltransferase
VPKLSTLVLSWNARDTLRQALTTYRATTAGIDQEVLVLDNASTDGSAEMVRREFPSVRLLQSPQNLGYAGGNNRLYAEASGEYVLLLNDDVVVPDGTIPALVRYLDAHPNAAGATCRLTNPDGSTQYYYHRRLPRALTFLTSMLHTYGLWRNNPYARRDLMLDNDFSREQVIEQTAGTCLLLRRSAIERVGGLFDAERFPILLNDVDLARRLADAKLWVWLVPGISLTHLKAQSTDRLEPYFFRQIFFSAMVLYFGKHGPLGAYVLTKLGLVVLLGGYLVATALGLTRRYFQVEVSDRWASLASQLRILRTVLTDERVTVVSASPHARTADRPAR